MVPLDEGDHPLQRKCPEVPHGGSPQPLFAIESHKARKRAGGPPPPSRSGGQVEVLRKKATPPPARAWKNCILSTHHGAGGGTWKPYCGQVGLQLLAMRTKV
uniref:Uncharacterized protein n=1 Tax=Micrurus lemniscatus lemniscatus TaxID=129467 RepID=A0A2D4JBJ7_MICLE